MGVALAIYRFAAMDFKDYYQPTSDYEMMIIQLFAGYFVYDFIALWMNGILYWVPFTHHLIVFGIFSMLAYSTYGGTLFLFGFIMCELTGPLQCI